MKLRQIEIVRAVVRFHTTIAAADHLGMTQPAVSGALRQIENQLGFPLFERVNNRLFPLEAANILAEESDPIFAVHAALEQRMQDFRDNEATRLRVISTPPLGNEILPAAIGDFSRRHPRLVTYFDVRDLDGVIRAVEAGKFDIGFGLDLGPQPTLSVQNIAEDRMVVVCRPDHPLASRQSIRPSDLAGHDLVALDADTRMGAAVREAYREDRQPFLIKAQARTCSVACSLVAQGVGLAVVDPFTARQRSQASLRVIPFEPAIPSVVWAFWTNRNRLSETTRRFLAHLGRSVQTTGAHPPPGVSGP